MFVGPGQSDLSADGCGIGESRSGSAARRRRRHKVGRGHQEGLRARDTHVVGPQVPDGVPPGLKLREEGISLGDVGIRLLRGRRAGECQVARPVDLIPQELDVLTAGGLVVEVYLNVVRALGDGQ